MHAIAHFDGEIDRAALAIALFEHYSVDVGVKLGDGGGDRGQHAALIFYFDADSDRKYSIDFFLPLHVYPFFRMLAEFGHIRAIFGVNHNAASRRQKSQYRITRYRPATASVIHHNPFSAADRERRLNLCRRFSTVKLRN